MSPALTVKAFAFYVLLTGAALLLAPQLLLRPLGFANPQDLWVRVLGAVGVVQSYYYHACAMSDDRRLLAALVRGRLAFSAILAGLVLAGVGPWMLLLFAGVDVVFALWTRAALRAAAPVGP